MAKRIFYCTQEIFINDKFHYPQVPAASWEKALQAVFKPSWMRFTMWEKDSDKRKHYKIIQKKGKWTIKFIPSREFDFLSWTKLKEICTRLPSYPKLPSPSKELLLDFLDDNLKEARNIRNRLEIMDYLGEFWFERKDSEITVSLRKEAKGRTYDIEALGIMEHFLISMDLIEGQNEELKAKIKSLESPEKVAKNKPLVNKNLSKLTQTVEELTGKLDKITSSFEASEQENNKLRKTIKGLKAELALAKADNSILRNELVISKIEPTATSIEEERVLNTDSMDPFECY